MTITMEGHHMCAERTRGFIFNVVSRWAQRVMLLQEHLRHDSSFLTNGVSISTFKIVTMQI